MILAKDAKYNVWMNGVQIPDTVVIKATIPKPDIKRTLPANFTFDYEMQELSVEFDAALEEARQKVTDRAYITLENMLVEKIIGPYRDKGKRQW